MRRLQKERHSLDPEEDQSIVMAFSVWARRWILMTATSLTVGATMLMMWELSAVRYSLGVFLHVQRVTGSSDDAVCELFYCIMAFKIIYNVNKQNLAHSYVVGDKPR